MGVLLGLLSAVCWGSADFFARGATRLAGTYRVVFFIQFFGFVALGVYLLVSGELVARAGEATSEEWAVALAFAVLYMISNLALYRSFETGTMMAVVSPIGASYAAITVLLSLLSGEQLPAVRAVGILLALIGVVLSATDVRLQADSGSMRRTFFSTGVRWALFAAVSYGVTFWLLGFYVAPAFGGILPVWLVRVVTIGVLLALALPQPGRLRPPPAAAWRLILFIGFLDTAAFVANVLGLTTEQVSVVTVLGSMFSAVTVILSWLFLHERLAPSQWAGIALIFSSLVLVSL